MLKKVFFFIFCYLTKIRADSKEITIFVEDVPKYYTPFDEDIFISGTFNGWVLNDSNFKMDRISHNTFRKVIKLENGNYDFKFTRGSMNTIETYLNGTELNPNRKLIVNSQSSSLINTKIENWKDMVGNHTAKGNLHIISSKFLFKSLNTLKTITIYLPTDYYTTNKSYPVLYINDGHAAFDVFFNNFNGDIRYDEMMEDFFKESKEVSIMVGIDHKTMEGRTDEMTPFPNNNPPTGAGGSGGKGDFYVDDIVNNLKPYIDQNFRTKSHRNFTGIIGYSLGGLISFYAGIKYQNIFSKIGAFSATYLWNDTIYDYVNKMPVLFDDTKFYCLVGGFENGTYEGILYDMITTMNKMVNILHKKGYKNVVDKFYPEGKHEDWFWTREFPRAYNYFYPNSSDKIIQSYFILSFNIIIFNILLKLF